MDWNTLHIFGYGQDQLISETENKLVDADLCPATQDTVDMVYALKPDGNAATTNYRNINIFNGLFADYADEEGNRFRVEWAELETALINILAAEIQNA